jgi:hypothetical protein
VQGRLGVVRSGTVAISLGGLVFFAGLGRGRVME